LHAEFLRDQPQYLQTCNFGIDLLGAEFFEQVWHDMLNQSWTGQHALFQHLLELLGRDLVSVIFWRLKIDWKVTRYLVKEGLFELLADLFRRVPVKRTAIRAHEVDQHEVREIEAKDKITRVFLTFDRGEYALDERDRVGHALQEKTLLQCELLVGLEDGRPGPLIIL